MGTPIASTRVWHDGKPYDVSTIDRECSAVGAHGMMYAETIVWEVGDDGSRGDVLCQEEAAAGSMIVHQNLVDTLREYGPRGIDGNAT